MKRVLVILTILMIFNLACSFSGLISEQDLISPENRHHVRTLLEFC